MMKSLNVCPHVSKHGLVPAGPVGPGPCLSRCSAHLSKEILMYRIPQNFIPQLCLLVLSSLYNIWAILFQFTLYPKIAGVQAG